MIPVGTAIENTGLYDTSYVTGFFDELSPTYTPVNIIGSFGMERVLRGALLWPVKRSDKPRLVADLMCGHGESWPMIKAHLSHSTIDGYDCSSVMLADARRRNPSVNTICADILTASFPANTYDLVICAFGLKLLHASQYATLAAQVSSMLKPGGQFSFIEVSKPANPILRALFQLQLRVILPFAGRLMGSVSYSMLWNYVAHYDHELPAIAFREAGLDTYTASCFGGMITAVHGYKQ